MILEVKNLKKYFRPKRPGASKAVRAVDDVSFAIAEGEHLGLVGESGSGKTTLGRVVMRLYLPDDGKIILNGNDITSISGKKMRPYRKKIQMVFQDPYNSLDPRYSIREILREAISMLDKSAKPQQEEEKMVTILKDVGLKADCLDRFPHEFSGGERQRIAIARALIMNPSLIILDEAVSSLDVLIQSQIINLLISLHKQYKITYLFITHNLRVVRRLCPNLAVMYRGRIVEMGKTEELFKNPLHPYTRMLLDAAINYKSSGPETSIEITENSQLIDKGDGHFVIN